MRKMDLTVGQRLTLGSAIVAVLIVILGGFVVSSVSEVRRLRTEKIEVIGPRAAAADALRTAVFRQAVAFRNYLLTNAPEDLTAFRDAQQDVAARIEEIAALPKRPWGETLLAQIRAISKEHQSSFDAYLADAAKGIRAEQLRAGELAISRNRVRLLDRIEAFAALQTEQARAADAAVTRAVDSLRLTIVIVAFLILLSSIVTAAIVTRSVSGPAAGLAAAAEAMRNGSFEPALRLAAEGEAAGKARGFRDELREASAVFGRMAVALRLREQRLEASARLSSLLASTLEPAGVAGFALRELAAYAGAEVGVLYAIEEGEMLRPLATFGLGGADAMRVGEGIPGQAAAGRETAVIRDLPADSPFTVRLGFDSLPPRSLVACPMEIEGRCTGVIVLGALREIGSEAVQFVEESSHQIAVSVENALSHVRITALAAELRESGEVLQQNNEELQAQREELQAQAEELQAQNEELQAQSEELQAQSEELQAQSEELHARQETLASRNEALLLAEEQKNRFLALLGHELRNPLAAIHSASGLLEDAQRDGAPALVDVIRRQTVHLTRMVDDLLDVGRITSGKIVLSRRPVDVGAAVARCVRSASDRGSESHAPIGLEAAGGVWAEADETRLEQIVTNLLTNALKYTPPDGSISVSVTREQEQAVICVRDSGAGIDAELLPRIFDFFVQGNDRPHESRGGLGVGLTLVKSLVELHGGSVEAASPGRGEGTTVTVSLPAIEPPAATGLTHEAVPAKSAEGKKIVVIEDNADVRRMMLLVLRGAGHTVADAHDGPSGLEVLRAERPDLALVDLDLPGFDGYEVARLVKSDVSLANVALIALSGYGSPDDRARALAAGFADHFVKPVDLDQLERALRGEARGDA